MLLKQASGWLLYRSQACQRCAYGCGATGIRGRQKCTPKRARLLFMSDKQTYVPCMRDDLIAKVGILAAALAVKLCAYADEKGAILVSFDALSKLWNIDARKIKNAAKTLDLLQIWHYKRGDGRGHVTEWQKGANFDTFVPLKRVQNLQIKGAKIATYNKDYNKDRLIARTRVSINQSIKNLNKSKAGDTPAPPIMDELFNTFWVRFFSGPYKKHEAEQVQMRERAAVVFSLMPEEQRKAAVEEITRGKRYDKTHWVLWYLQHWQPSTAKYAAQGTIISFDEYYKEFGTTVEQNGWKMINPTGNKVQYIKQ